MTSSAPGWIAGLAPPEAPPFGKHAGIDDVEAELVEQGYEAMVRLGPLLDPPSWRDGSSGMKSAVCARVRFARERVAVHQPRTDAVAAGFGRKGS